MKVETLKLYSYDLELSTPLKLRDGVLNSRKGLLLQIADGRGRRAVCDIAPLPYFSPDALEPVLEMYAQFKEKLLGSFWSLKLLLSRGNILNEGLSSTKYPSLFFGIEFALLSLLMPKFSLFKQVNVNSLLVGSDEAILQKLSTQDSYGSIKVKVGPRSPEEMLVLIQKMLPLMHPSQKIRIDGNRAWTLRETLFFAEHMPHERCEYFEEPLQEPTKLHELSELSSLPLAFDESLFDQPLDYLLSIPTKKALIIKPTLMGSLQKMNALYQKACKHKLQFVLSSCFESGLGHLMIAHLCRYLGIQTPIGLDTYHWFKEDVLLDPLVFTEGQLILPKENLVKPKLNFKKLRLLDV